LEKLDMRKFATMAAAAGLALATTATPASAGAIEALFDEPPTSIEEPVWTGFYAGAFAGGAWWNGSTFSSVTPYGDATIPDVVPPHSWGVPSATSFLGGATMGLNWRLGCFLLGVEGEVAFMGFKASALDPFDTTHNPYGQLTYNDWEEFIGGRAGVLWGNALIYGKLGAVFGEYQGRVYIGNPKPDNINDINGNLIRLGGASVGVGDTTNTALAVGGGVEYALSRHWSAKIEYMYMDFASTLPLQGCRPTEFIPCVNGTRETSDAWTTSFGGAQTVKIGLNYRFTGWRDESPFK
jgi:outer membrane immunogenic protein